jgi:hypothetical protein
LTDTTIQVIPDSPVVVAPVVIPPYSAVEIPLAPVAQQENTMTDVATSVPASGATHTFFPNSGTGTGTAAAGMGAGGLLAGGALGGIAGLVLGSMLGNRGGLFGGNNGGNGDGAVALGYGELVEAIGDAKLAGVVAAGENRATTLEQTSMLQTAIATTNFNTLNTVNGLGRDVQASNTQQLITNLQSFNTLAQQNQVSFNALSTASAEAASDIKAAIATQTARAEAIAAASALANQECCCEIKNAIRNSTDAILGNLTSTRIQDLQIENSNLRQTQTLTALLAERGHDHIMRTA